MGDLRRIQLWVVNKLYEDLPSGMQHLCDELIKQSIEIAGLTEEEAKLFWIPKVAEAIIVDLSEEDDEPGKRNPRGH